MAYLAWKLAVIIRAEALVSAGMTKADAIAQAEQDLAVD